MMPVICVNKGLQSPLVIANYFGLSNDLHLKSPRLFYRLGNESS